MTSRRAQFSHRVQRTIKRYGWLGVPAALLGIGLIILLNVASPSHTIKVTPTALNPTSSVTITDLGRHGFLGLWAGVGLSIVGLILFALWLSQQQYNADSRPAQIRALTKSLTDAMGIIASINSEVEEGQRVLTELESRTADQRELASLTSEESEAVRNLVGSEIRGERRFTLTTQAVVGVVAGLIAGFLLAHL